MKKSFSDLIIEVTRNCNLECSHCLRGCAQNEKMSFKMIDSILDQVDSIGAISFTGGEPLLVPEVLIYTIDEIMRRGIPVTSFFMVTNATIFSKEVYFKLVEFYWYCDDENDEEGMNCLCVSLDEFHDNNCPDIINKWKSLIFYKDYKEHTFNYQGIIDEGTANENGIGTRELILEDNKFEAEIFDDVINIYEMVYINVFGQIVNDCDMSYQTQEEHVLGTIKNDDYYTISA